MSPLNTTALRSSFPALTKNPNFIFGDNAGGSQILQASVDAVTDYLINTNIQMGSDYMPASTERCMKLAQGLAVKMFNAKSADEIVFGGSSTQNVENLARGLEGSVKEGDEIIVTWEHEANCGPWKSLAARTGATIKYWEPTLLNSKNPFSYSLDPLNLIPLITSRTRLLAFTACSNILGSILPIASIVSSARTAAASAGSPLFEVCLDCVAYAPHRRIDVQAWDVDYCIMSFYKVYGPHVGAMYVRHQQLTSSVSSIVHHFLSPEDDRIGYKLQPAGPGYESVWGTTAVVPYLEGLTEEGTLEAASEAMSAHDAELAGMLLEFLTEERQWKRGVRVVGEEKAGPDRMPTVSFVVGEGEDGEKAMKSRTVVKGFDKKGKIGIRYGHFYAFTLVSAVKPDDPSDGVVRISFVHYNTKEEVQSAIDTLKEVLYAA
ncbi:selenocysteine lyase [Microthyrium microscopicum]|uniref:Selenocysteine lyase n=1 Tax=Microthyrium microscopicum TaxID=703497 RepID=A0A6A6U8X1_9PEZI|nr:selenocysteine lyase [Microthyrium microscopicum]